MKRKFILLTLVIATLIVPANLQAFESTVEEELQTPWEGFRVQSNGDSPAKATVTPLSRGPMIYGKPRQNGSLPSNLRSSSYRYRVGSTKM